jgi:3-oxoacyl-[acyl-carrier-protein] synthase-3
MLNPRAKIVGVGMQVPDRIVTNHDLAAIMDTSDEWIQKRTGIRERRYVDSQTKPSDLGTSASLKALDAAGMKPADVDMLIVATLSPEHFFPGTAAFVQRKLGLGTTPAIDLRNQCSGFIYGLSLAKALIESGQYRNILICCTEVHSRALDFTNRGRDVAVLFGDGAAAIVLTATDDVERGILAVKLHCDGTHAEKLWIEQPGLACEPHIDRDGIEAGRIYPKMDGPFVFKNAVARLPEVIGETLATLRLTAQDIDHYFFHQANLRINQHVAECMAIPESKLHNNIDRYGNCSAASIPMCLTEAVGEYKVRSGELICFAAFGSGFTWASAVVRW